MRCRHCDHENERAANFCSSCGESLEDDETTVALELVEDRRILEEELGDVLEQLPPGMGLLVVRRGPISGSTFVLDAETVALGRHPHSDIFLDDVTVSRRHATICHRASGYDITDAGSLNGTYVDHERTESAPLHDMSEIQIGRFVLTFVLGTGKDAA